jgi:hypothetical protein
MKIKMIHLAVILILFTFFSYAQNGRTLKVNKGGNLNISLTIGDIELTTWDKDQLVVKTDDEDDSGLEISQVGSNVNISSSVVSWGNDLIISLPSRFNINVKTMGGDIKMKGDLTGAAVFSTSGGDMETGKVNGNVDLETSGGDITTGEINGDAVISTSGGDIALGKISGKADIQTSGGNITMNSVGNSADIITAGGNITVTNIGGDADIKTGGGNIYAKVINGKAKIKTGGGNISLDHAAGYTDAETGAGNINIDNAVNNFKASTGAGDIYVKLNSSVKGDCELKSGTGSITLYVSPDAKVTINAVVKSIGWGNDGSDIISDFPAASNGGKKNVSQQTFEINGGGSTINVYAALGNIHIIKQK